MKTKIVPALMAVALLAGCSGVKSQMGLGRKSPDEFTVVKRAPLTLPPDYGVLPQPGSESAAAVSSVPAKEAAKSVVFGADNAEKSKGSAEEALLGKLGATAADPSVRKEIDREQGELSLGDRGLTEKLMFWKSEDDKTRETLVDPSEEAVRIKKNQEEGKPVNAGDVPVIEKEKTVFDKLF